VAKNWIVSSALDNNALSCCKIRCDFGRFWRIFSNRVVRQIVVYLHSTLIIWWFSSATSTTQDQFFWRTIPLFSIEMLKRGTIPDDRNLDIFVYLIFFPQHFCRASLLLDLVHLRRPTHSIVACFPIYSNKSMIHHLLRCHTTLDLDHNHHIFWAFFASFDIHLFDGLH